MFSGLLDIVSITGPLLLVTFAPNYSTKYASTLDLLTNILRTVIIIPFLKKI